jgi:hypothetical protein
MSLIRATLAELRSKLRTASYYSAPHACLLDYQCDRPVNAARIEPTRRPVPTIGFDLRRLGVWEARDNAIDRPRGLRAAFGQIKSHLADGDTYQVNYTFRMEGSFMGDPRNLFGTDQHDVLLFHKTTNRTVYDRARSAGHDETALWNTHGKITEAATANIIVERDGGAKVTPPAACGLLAGTFRADLLARGPLSEAVVTIEELRSARRIWLINSIHEWRPAVMS